MARARSVAAWSLALLACASAARGAEIRAVDGSWDEDVTAIREEGGRFVVRTPNRALPLDQVKSIRFREGGIPSARPGRPLVKVVLASGDALRGAVAGGDADALSIESPGLGVVAVPLELVRAVLVDCTPERERELEGQLARRATLDRLLLKDGGGATGTIERIDEGRVVLDTTVEGGSKLGKDFSASLAKVELVALAEPGQPTKLAGVHVQAVLVDGSYLTGRLVRLDASGLRIEHPLGAGGTLDLPLERLASLVVQGGAVTYLSDLEPRVPVDQHFPAEFAYEPDLWGWKRDRNVVGGPLRIGGRTFDKGLGVHSYCALTYDLGGAYRELRAVIALDDVTRGAGDAGLGGVVFKVLVDGKPAGEPGGWKKLAGDPGTPLAIDVTNARALTLIVDFDPSTLHILGRADWADAHLIKR